MRLFILIFGSRKSSTYVGKPRFGLPGRCSHWVQRNNSLIIIALEALHNKVIKRHKPLFQGINEQQHSLRKAYNFRERNIPGGQGRSRCNTWHHLAWAVRHRSPKKAKWCGAWPDLLRIPCISSSQYVSTGRGQSRLSKDMSCFYLHAVDMQVLPCTHFSNTSASIACRLTQLRFRLIIPFDVIAKPSRDHSS